MLLVEFICSPWGVAYLAIAAVIIALAVRFWDRLVGDTAN